MGTNFFLACTEREVCDKYFGYDYELTDRPFWAYQIHIAKTSMGWLPFFQAHECFRSIRELKALYETGKFHIIDEYGDEYDWPEFDARVLKFNGGVKGAIPREEIKQDRSNMFFDPNLPKYRPISHFEYAAGRYSSDYFYDPDGYEFTNKEFF